MKKGQKGMMKRQKRGNGVKLLPEQLWLMFQ